MIGISHWDGLSLMSLWLVDSAISGENSLVVDLNYTTVQIGPALVMEIFESTPAHPLGTILQPRNSGHSGLQ